jgi:chromosome segregation ATPase
MNELTCKICNKECCNRKSYAGHMRLAHGIRVGEKQELKNKVWDLETENGKLKAQCAILEKESIALKTMIEQLQEEHKKLQKVYDDLRKQYDDVESVFRALKREYTELKEKTEKNNIGQGSIE